MRQKNADQPIFGEPQPTPTKPPVSAFDEKGMSRTISDLLDEIESLYLSDPYPWVVGYSGGKDSSATLQLVWMALQRMAPEQRTKSIHVISTDTLVENPIVAQWAANSLAAMKEAAESQGLPIHPHRLTPEVADSFWVLLIGKGYPAPRHLFRWCTDRLKIRPSTTFLRALTEKHRENILVLGTRKAESAGRRARMERLERERVRDLLSPNKSQPGSSVYTPIDDWSNDDVWLFLLNHKNPWGWDNRSLLTLYRAGSEDGECPLVVDTSTPSCGASRFGCWVCTLVEQDKSMQAMVSNDVDKEWMQPLLDLRNALDFRDKEDGDRPIRDFRRMGGKVMLMMAGGQRRVIPGPYTREAREGWLCKLLQAERWIREDGPDEVRNFEIVSVPELDAIRRIWLFEKHELEDTLPRIYEDVTGRPYPGQPIVGLPFSSDDLELLREAAGDEHTYQLARDLLAVEVSMRTMARRSKLFPALEGVLRRYTYRSEDEAIAALEPYDRARREVREAVVFGVEEDVGAEAEPPEVQREAMRARTIEALAAMAPRLPEWLQRWSVRVILALEEMSAATAVKKEKERCTSKKNRKRRQS